VSSFLFRNSTWREYTSDIPDSLFFAVCVITALSYSVYRIRIKRGIYNKDTFFFLLITYAVPASYLVKSILKYIFGKTNTREWLFRHGQYGFHWFHGGEGFSGFPSGHMAVFTVLAAALWRFYPRYRALYLFLSSILAFALIATNYHFLSDVIAGAYLGVVTEALTHNFLKKSYFNYKSNMPYVRNQLR
jgi:membrane-associated phospholipid phosphatase